MHKARERPSRLLSLHTHTQYGDYIPARRVTRAQPDKGVGSYVLCEKRADWSVGPCNGFPLERILAIGRAVPAMRQVLVVAAVAPAVCAGGCSVTQVVAVSTPRAPALALHV